MARNRTMVVSVVSVVTAPIMAEILARFIPANDPITTPKPDDHTLAELFEERSAIREYDGKLSRADAECLAARDVSAATEIE